MRSRRRFLQQVATAPLAVGTPLVTAARGFATEAPSDRLNVAFIGTGHQGMALLKRFVTADLGNVLAVCDVNEGSTGYKDPAHFYGRMPAKELVEAASAKKSKSGSATRCDAYADFRQVLDRQDIEAVCIVVPDHWHRIMTTMALEAGKDVYCEKPLTFAVADGPLMIAAVRKHDRILQTGSHQRSNPVSMFVCDAAKAGKIGTLKKIVTKVGFNNMTGPGPGWQPMPVPKNLDYPMWLGPAPVQPYHNERCLFRFRFNYDYAGGQITNFGAHSNDLAHCGMGLETGGPVEVECLAAKFLPAESLFNTATETRFRCLYANGVELLCESGPENMQIRFEGSDGWLQTGFDGTTSSDPSLLEGLPAPAVGLRDPHTAHMANFVDCVKTRNEPLAPVEVGHASATLCHIANAMVRLFPETGSGVVAKWDAKRERFTNNEAANRMLDREIREPWK